MNEPILKKSNLNFYNVISEPGTYIVKVANTVKPSYLIEDDNGKSRFLVNLRAATMPGFKECLFILGKREICKFSEVNHCFQCGALWENSLEDLTLLPVKGEDVIANFDFVGDELMCNSITLIPRKTLDTFDLNAQIECKKLYKDLIKNIDE